MDKSPEGEMEYSSDSDGEWIQEGGDEIEDLETFLDDPDLYWDEDEAKNRGSEDPGRRRAPLPIEIIIKIFDIAELIKSMPTKSRELYSGLASEIVVYSDGPRRSQLFMYSASLTREALQHIRQLQLETIAHDQGWATGPGNWTWFEIVILTPVTGGDSVDDCIASSGLENYQVKVDASDPTRQLQWVSHANIRAKVSFNYLKGQIFTPDHEIWGHLDENDIIGVTALAQFPGWSNTVSIGRIRFWEKFDPAVLG
ncbi:hypothetical protein CPB86DRAFT_796511 [Serendipita vermifera]|nr:hypothetical protein CPB86DRAFT_796511 [Serendipita vermifera]